MIVSQRKGKEFRLAIINYLSHRGAYIDLNNLDININNWLSSAPQEFRTLILTQEDFGRFKNIRELVSSVLLDIEKAPRFDPSKFLSDRKDLIIGIAKFFKDLAIKFGPIKIYGYNLRDEGFGFRKDSTNPYHPTQDKSLVDTNMPKAGSDYNNKFFIVDPGKLNEFNDDELGFPRFLGAFFADYQTFIIKADGMLESEILFSFNFITGEVNPVDIIPRSYHANWFVPCSRASLPLAPRSQSEYDYAKSIYNKYVGSIIEKEDLSFVIAKKPSKFSAWLEACKVLKSFTSLAQ